MSRNEAADRPERSAFVAVFDQRSVLDAARDRLRAEGCRAIEFRCDAWSSDADMYDAFAAQLDFPEYFGRNLDALNDCLSDIATGSCGWDASVDTGVVVVLREFDAFAVRERQTARALLEIAATQVRSASSIGHRVVWLVQSNDPRIRSIRQN